VVEALVGALRLPAEDEGWYDIPGPDVVTVREILMATARRIGKEPLTIDVPFLTPKLSSYWLRFVTECDTFVAQQLVQGLKTDLLAESDEFWDKIGHRDRIRFETAIKRMLEDDEAA
jgi:nucleoside-diphosphate-sugar epimerase